MSQYYDIQCQAVPRPAILARDTSGQFWRQDDPILTPDKKLVKGGMWPTQRAWWNLPNFIRAYVAGYGAGKTIIGCKRVVSLALANAPCPVAVVSPTFPIARQTVIPTIKEILSGKRSLYGRNFWWKYLAKSPAEFQIMHNGKTALILVYSGEDPESLKGPNLAAALMDEPFLMEEACFTQMIARIRHPLAKHLELDLTGTPEQLNWGYDLCIGEYKEKFDVGLVTASTRQNLVLAEGYVGRLEGAFTDKAAEAYIEGKFVNLSKGIVYYAFDRLPVGLDPGNVVELPVPDNAELGAGMDFNVNPMAMVAFWTAGSHMHVFDEYELPNADTEYACEILRENYVYDKTPDRPGRKTKQRLETVFPDATGSARKTAAPGGKSDFTYIEQAGFIVDAPHENPKIRDREQAVNGKFKPRNGPRTLTISPKCKRLVKYLSVYAHETRNKQEAMSHLLCALGYPVSRKFPVDREVMRVLRLTGA